MNFYFVSIVEFTLDGRLIYLNCVSVKRPVFQGPDLGKLYPDEIQSMMIGNITLRECLRVPFSQYGIVCPICQKRSIHRQEHLGHINSHFNLNPYRCSQCSKAYKQQPSLFYHLKSCHGHQRN